jgi:hypothetical protein
VSDGLTASGHSAHPAVHAVPPESDKAAHRIGLRMYSSERMTMDAEVGNLIRRWGLVLPRPREQVE